MNTKNCSKCKTNKSLDNFWKSSKHKCGYTSSCIDCSKKYYEDNKQRILETNKAYRESHKDEIFEQRKGYRERNQEHIKQKQKEYLPVRKERIKEKRKTDLNFRMSEILRSKVHRMLKGINTSYMNLIGCSIEQLKAWLEFQFDENMTWDNLGIYWQVDHILPINQFNLSNELDQRVCFNWTNLQPLEEKENKSKSDKLLLHYYFNSIVTIHRFCQLMNSNLGYQRINESRYWLREKLRYGKNPPDEDVLANTSKMGNPQPSS